MRLAARPTRSELDRLRAIGFREPVHRPRLRLRWLYLVGGLATAGFLAAYVARHVTAALTCFAIAYLALAAAALISESRKSGAR